MRVQFHQVVLNEQTFMAPAKHFNVEMSKETIYF